ncbi:C6 zinc finger domain protein [Colletotrichum higginsianum]|nr:C6 zinc finger domain protein [Colletotrichum higginsianum]
MFFAQTVPAVRNAAIALALIHQNYLDGFSSGCAHRPQQPLECMPSDRSPLLHYNRAIQLLLNLEIGDSTETTAITLLVCYLFSCFDHLAGNYVQAVKHLRGGVELSRNIDKSLLNNNELYDDAKPSGVRTVICQVTRQIRRLDAQAVTYLIDWTPADIQEALTPHFPTFDSAFQSLDQAADQLQILVARVMILHYTAQQMSLVDEIPQPPVPPKDIVLGQLETWLSLFENMSQLGNNSYETDSETYPLISLLRLQHTISWTLLSGHGPGGEMEYDKFLPQFRQCVALAGYVAAAHERYAGSLKPSFTPEIGIVPVLYIIGVKCRQPVVRREVLRILRQRPIREAVWDSIYAARVVERAIEIEEDGGDGEREAATSMEQIAVWQRIESMSWADVVDGKSPARLDIAYTFCTREGMHMESLLI